MKKRFSDVKEIIYKDSYLIRDYSKDSFDYVVDIGSNAGTFVISSNILFPKAKIFAYEPCIDSYNLMCENLYGFSNIKMFNKALGDGKFLNFKCVGEATCTGNQFVAEDIGTYKIESVVFNSIFEKNNIDINKNILLKIDCEGGEKHLLNNKYNYILQKCKHIAIEVHFQCLNKSFDNLPKWEEYSEWINRVFIKTHSIIYHRSNKNKGVGVYVLKRKE